jgi:hypothetical protein
MGEVLVDYRGKDKPKPTEEQIAANAQRWRDLYETVEKIYQANK